MTLKTDPIVETKNLVKHFGSQSVLKSLNLTVYKGEIYGFIGHNGAGKSTAMQLIMGLLKADGGTIHMRLTDPLKIGYLPESPEFFPYMSAVQYLNYIGEAGAQSRNAIGKRTRELLDLVDLTHKATRPIGGFSRGMKQRLGLAVALYHDPDFLLLDEPSSALDPLGRQAMVQILENLKSQGKTIFLSTHILDDIERICDRVGVLHSGVLQMEGPLSELLKASGGQGVSVEFALESNVEAVAQFCQQVSHEYKISYHPLESKKVLFNSPMEGDLMDGDLLDGDLLDQDRLLAMLLSEASKSPVLVKGILRHQLSLEDLYVKVVKS